MATEFTDAQLRQIAEFVARRYLEVERGLRSKQSLQKFLSPEAYARQTYEGVSRFGRGGVVRQGDIGQIIFQRPRHDRAYVAIPARQQGERWGALVMEMRANDRGVWRVTELTRAQDRNVIRGQALLGTRETDADRETGGLTRTLIEARTARKVAAERHAAALRELGRLAPEKPAAELRAGDHINTGATPDQHWTVVRAIETTHDDGAVTVTAADGTRLRVAGDRPVSVLAMHNDDFEAARRSAAAAGAKLAAAVEELARWDGQVQALERENSHLPPRENSLARDVGTEDDLHQRPYLVRTLGDPPDDRDARDVWDAAARAIETYRDRWLVTNTDSALGPQPSDADQRSDRDATVAALRELTAELTDRRGGRDPFASDLQAVGREVEADPFAHSLGGRA